MLQEWATPLTLINYLLLGCASGTASAAALCGMSGRSALARAVCARGLVLTLAAPRRAWPRWRATRALRPKSDAADGDRHPAPPHRAEAQGFMGGSFNTREFFHGATPQKMRAIKWAFLLLAFAVPVLVLLALASGQSRAGRCMAAFVCSTWGSSRSAGTSSPRPITRRISITRSSDAGPSTWVAAHQNASRRSSSTWCGTR